MASPAHHLRRLRLQVHTDDLATGQELRSRFEAGLSRRLAAVVAALCEELGPAEEVLRLDRLELQLGTFALEELDQEAPLALERALREALLQALAAARHNPVPGQRLLAAQEARLEGLATFLRLGVVPCRFASAPFAPVDDLLALLRDDPASLLALLRRLAGERSALERLLQQLDSERFALLLGALAPADANLILTYLADLLRLHQQRPLLAVGPEPLRRGLWLVTLTLLLRDPGSSFNRRTFLDQLLRGLAAEHRLSYSVLLRQLEQALRQTRRAQPPGGSLPALLAELLGLRRTLAPALAGASRDPEPLLALLRADPTNPELHRALEPRLSGSLFSTLVRAIEPEQAPLVLATVADVALVHHQQPLLPLPLDPFERLVRRVALQLLLVPAGSPFERLSFLRQLLRHLAQSQRLVYADLLRTFAAALSRLPRPLPLQTSLPALLETLIAAELVAGAPLDGTRGGGREASDEAGEAADAPARPAASHPAAVDRRVPPPAATDPTAPTFPRALPGEGESLSDGTGNRLRARGRPRPPFAEALWDAFLRAGHPAHLGLRLQEAVERDPASFAALLRSLLAALPGAAESRETTRAEPLPVGPSSLDRSLLLARLLRWLLPDALAAIAAAAAPEPQPPAVLLARWAEWLADVPGSDLATAWSQLLPQRLADPTAPLPSLPACAADHLDRLALLRAWLGLEAPPPWLAAPGGEPPAWVVPLLRGASELDLRRLLQLPAAEPAALLLALRRLQGLVLAAEPGDGASAAALESGPDPGGPASSAVVDGATFAQLLERLLPWLRHPTGPLAQALAAAPSAAERDAVRLRAVALALAGGVLTLEELRRPLPPLPPPAVSGASPEAPPGSPSEANPEVSPVPPSVSMEVAAEASASPPPADASRTAPRASLAPTPNDRQRLLVWLSGEGQEVPAQLPTLLRLFAQLADQGDAELLACLRQGAGQSEPRRRWRRQLPEALLGRVVLLLQPGRGRLLLDLQALLSLAWRQAALPGDPQPVELPWETLLPLLVSPRPLPTRRISERLLEALCGSGDRRQPAAERLLRRARQLASTSGAEAATTAALPLLAALEPPPAVPPDASDSAIPSAGAPPASSTAGLSMASAASSLSPREALAEALAEGLYIANAGLVLFNPFLPRFFERLGVLTPASDDRPLAITGLEARSRAVHLLQWLVDERLDAPEPDLALNKVLAGLDLTEPILSRHSASDDELAIATELLQAVLQHWPPLVNTSIAGLRETFLRREGRLELPSLENNQWSLLVQRRTVDVLMDRMPWPITPLRHRWMAAPLHVTW